jgi:Calcineurin-like phosphoesterase
MRTVVVSDLHLGARSALLHDAGIRAVLAEALRDADRLVLLGDVIELRHGPARDAMAAAEPALRELGAAMAGREVVVLAGNHDHALLAPWLEARAMNGAGPLALDERVEPSAAPLLETLAGWLGEARSSFAYPGVRLREDVWATHGHYVDLHLTIPTVERLAAGAMRRIEGPPTYGEHVPDAYEARLAPLYAWIHAAAQHAAGESPAVGGAQLSSGVWHRATRGRPRSPGRLALAAAIPAATALANRLGLGPVHPDISSEALRRAGLAAMGAVTTTLEVDAAHVLFGHTHRAGPLATDDHSEWRAIGGATLHNPGSWVLQPHFLTSRTGESPYWPGGILVVEDDGPPRLERLLAGRPLPELRAALRPPPRRA